MGKLIHDNTPNLFRVNTIRQSILIMFGIFAAYAVIGMYSLVSQIKPFSVQEQKNDPQDTIQEASSVSSIEISNEVDSESSDELEQAFEQETFTLRTQAQEQQNEQPVNTIQKTSLVNPVDGNEVDSENSDELEQELEQEELDNIEDTKATEESATNGLSHLDNDDWKVGILHEKMKKTINTYMLGSDCFDFMIDVLNHRSENYNFVYCDEIKDAQFIIVVYSKPGIRNLEKVEQVNQRRSEAVVVFYSGENVVADNDNKMWDKAVATLEEVDIAISFNHKENVDLSESKKVKDFARLPYGYFSLDPETCFFEPETYRYISSKDHYGDWVNRPNDVSFFSNHLKFPREELFDLMTNVTGHVDSYGKAKYNIGPIEEKEFVPKIPPCRLTKFAITPENSAGDGYFTEKIYQAFVAGQVPIYWPNYPEPGVFNKDRVLLYDPDNKGELIEKVNKLMNDETYAREFFDKPVFQPTAAAYAQSTCDEYASTIFKALDRKVGPNEDVNTVANEANQLAALDNVVQVKTYVAGRETSDFMYKVLNYQPSEYKFVRCDDMADADLIIVIGGVNQYSGMEYDNESHEVNLLEEANEYKSQAVIIYHSDGSEDFYKDDGIDESFICVDEIDLLVSFKEAPEINVDRLEKVNDYARLPPGFFTFDPETCFFDEDSLHGVIENITFIDEWRHRKQVISFYSSISDFYLYPRQEMYNKFRKGSTLHGSALKSVRESTSHVYSKSRFTVLAEKSENTDSGAIFEAFKSGAVPIYWPPVNPEPKIFSDERIIFYDPNNDDPMEEFRELKSRIKLQKERFAKPALQPDAKEYAQSLCDQYSKSVFDALNKKLGKSQQE